MLQNYFKSTKKTKIIFLPLWVLFGFYSAQLFIVLLIGVLKAGGVSFDGLNEALLNLVFASVIYVLTIGIVIWVPFALRKYKTNFSELGFTRWLSWKDILVTPFALIAYLIFSSILLVVAMKYLPWFNANQVQDTGFNNLRTQFEYIAAFIALVVIAPVAEETLFRGFLFGKLRKSTTLMVSMLITSIVFGYLHGAWNLAFDTFALSMVLCYLRESTGSIWASILLHMTKNGIAYYILFISPLMLNVIK